MSAPKLLSDLSMFKPLFPVRVKVLCKGRTVVGSRFHTDELIIGDEKGNTIQATFIRELDASYEIPLYEGRCYEITNFKLSHASDVARLSKNRYNLILSNSSVILNIDPIQHSSFYFFPDFLDLYHGLHHPKYPIDVYGVVVRVGFLEEYITQPTDGSNGIIDHKIRFFVRHTSNVVVKCVAYGAHAHEFHDLWNAIDADNVFCVLQFWKINWGTEKRRLKNVSTIDGVSKIFIDPNNVPEIDDLKKRIGNGES